jgi:hypothetical protein
MSTYKYHHVKLAPWKGKRYGRSKAGIKILVVGESHYRLATRIPKD